MVTIKIEKTNGFVSYAGVTVYETFNEDQWEEMVKGRMNLQLHDHSDFPAQGFEGNKGFFVTLERAGTEPDVIVKYLGTGYVLNENGHTIDRI